MALVRGRTRSLVTDNQKGNRFQMFAEREFLLHLIRIPGHDPDRAKLQRRGLEHHVGRNNGGIDLAAGFAVRGTNPAFPAVAHCLQFSAPTDFGDR